MLCSFKKNKQNRGACWLSGSQAPLGLQGAPGSKIDLPSTLGRLVPHVLEWVPEAGELPRPEKWRERQALWLSSIAKGVPASYPGLLSLQVSRTQLFILLRRETEAWVILLGNLNVAHNRSCCILCLWARLGSAVLGDFNKSQESFRTISPIVNRNNLIMRQKQ